MRPNLLCMGWGLLQFWATECSCDVCVCDCCPGAGKTSVINTIFRLMELDEGAIEIDGVQISTLGLAQLRNAMAIIPQVLLSEQLTRALLYDV